MSNFMKASKINLMFNSPKGPVMLQDLWVLPEKTIKDMANKLNSSLKSPDDIFSETRQEDSVDKLRLDILVSVVKEREKDKNTRVETKERKDRINFLKNVIKDKKLSKDKERDISDLEAELNKELENL